MSASSARWCDACSRRCASWTDSPPPTKKAKPAGASDRRFVAVDTNSPYVLSFNSEDGGKTNCVWMRWVSPTGERRPWSQQAQATIAA